MENAEEPINDSGKDDDKILSCVSYRTVTPTDIFQCLELEKDSYPSGEAASKNDLQYRQHHAAPYFRCCVLETEDDEDVVVGFICSTRLENCAEEDNVSGSHRPNGRILMVHSIVVAEEYRRRGIGRALVQDYLDSLTISNASIENPISKVALFAKQELLTFFLHSGFSVIRPCAAVDGKDQHYLLEMTLQTSGQFGSTSNEGTKCFVVDSFAAKPGTGNPAAVVLLPQDTNSDFMAEWMQTVAAEFNLSETAFCWPRHQVSQSSNEIEWNIRFYTPTTEVALCGHATLASAAVLYGTLQPKANSRIVFFTREDTLTMHLAKPLDEIDRLQTKICMEFPVKPPAKLTTQEDIAVIQQMLEACCSCKIETEYVGISEIGDVLVELNPESFWQIGYENLNYNALLKWDGYDRGIIVCCINDGTTDTEISDGDQRPDFFSRFFGPKAGINEDPVTGSAHCVLGPYFSEKLEKEKVIGKQMSKRGGTVECVVTGDKVKLTGSAITSMNGTLWI